MFFKGRRRPIEEEEEEEAETAAAMPANEDATLRKVRKVGRLFRSSAGPLESSRNSGALQSSDRPSGCHSAFPKRCRADSLWNEKNVHMADGNSVGGEGKKRKRKCCVKKSLDSFLAEEGGRMNSFPLLATFGRLANFEEMLSHVQRPRFSDLDESFDVSAEPSSFFFGLRFHRTLSATATTPVKA